MIYELLEIIINHATATILLIAPMQPCSNDVVENIPWNGYNGSVTTVEFKEGCQISYDTDTTLLPVEWRGYNAVRHNTQFHYSNNIWYPFTGFPRILCIDKTLDCDRYR